MSESEEAMARARYDAERAIQKKEKDDAEAAKMKEWAAYCKSPIKAGTVFSNVRGEVFKLVTVIEKPDPKRYGSGKYRAEYIGEDDPRNPCQTPMPLGAFETMGRPK